MNDTPDGFYSEDQVAKFFKMTLESLRKNYSTDKLRLMPKRTKLGAAWHYNKNEFHAWMEEQPKSGGEIISESNSRKNKKIYEKHQFVNYASSATFN